MAVVLMRLANGGTKGSVMLETAVGPTQTILPETKEGSLVDTHCKHVTSDVWRVLTERWM